MAPTPDLGILASHRAALDATRVVVVAIGDDQWHLPTPCDDWDVRVLLNHIVAGNWWASRLAAGETIDEVGDVYDGDLLDPSPAREYQESAIAAARAFEAPGALDAPCAVSYGPVPGSVYAGHRFIDVLVHGWDLAIAIGHTHPLSTELATDAWIVIEPQLDMLRGSGAFGHEQTIPDDADAATRVLLALGRTPT
jgi:uncharacterized protein (TIGR03086 family)